ncbi:Pappalysin-1 [Tupaia chinensis]|uniref:Pappalysin-1 n=1 Tax=Tupaia chinensis TaxID=246437 RepID=L9L7K8_TUPCH|nr:Pappalysin-1 [Tupaia chinensis]
MVPIQIPGNIGLYDKCSYTSRDRGWVVGIHTVSDQGNRDPRYFFSLKTDRARQVTTINAHRTYLPGQWVYLAATYNGRLMKLYVNGAQVATSGEQVGGIFSPLTQKCKVLMLGGSALNHNYRGYVEHFSLWKVARTQQEILSDMDTHGFHTPLPQLLLQENWDNVKHSWSPMKDGNIPQVEFSNAHGFLLDTNLEPPLCGQTLCDNREVIASYNQLPTFRQPKVVRYRVVNLYDDGHENPTVSQQQVDFQHRQLAEAFKHYNISWELELLEVNNSSLRHRLILANCDISKIGDENCDPECNHTLTGHDAGDCRNLRHPAFMKKQQNGVCDMDCNYERFNFDGGECCDPEITDVTKTCFDPDSPHRAYLDVNELKSILRLDGSTHLNIFFANSSEEELAGVATWPWDKEALMHLGISEIQSCSDPCMETEPSFETGDLCNDTNPAPKHKFCGDPGPGNDTCGFHSFFNTPYNNFMSYADDDCTDSFTPNQVARMHCYLDLVYQSWQPSRKPAPIALAPQIVGHTLDSITLEWFPPIDGHFFERELGSACDLCLEGRVLVQYAFNASSPMPCGPSGHWSPREAEGHPDVEQPCKSSVRTWSPNSAVNPHTVPPACPEPQGCYLELEFRYPLVPESLTIWVTFVSTDWDSSGAVNDIKLLTISGKNISLGPQNVFCDVPLTIRLRDVGEEVYGIQIYTLDEHLEIDAAMLTSVADSPLCLECKPLQYKVIRDPPLQVDVASILHLNRRFTDMDLNLGSVYQYWVITISGTEESEPSPAAIYIHGSGYCGDGIIQKGQGEECDDMNKINGDGCSLFCQQEISFNCIDEPSRCYFHDGDGVCEEFEQKTSIKDCGVYTPQGFLDQWASNVSVSHQDQQCPGWVVIGQPAASQVCRTKVIDLSEGISQHAWYPCTISYYSQLAQNSFWLRAYFSQPMVAAAVIVHLVTDGTYYGDQKQETISVQLLDTKDQSHDLGLHVLSCRNNPLIIPVVHDLSQPFYHSQAVRVSFSSPLVAISGVALRSFDNFDPVTLSSCQRGETYSPAEQRILNKVLKARSGRSLRGYPAYFSQPMVAAAVIVHLVTDGTYYGDQKQETISVQLLDTKDQSHDLGLHVLSCRNNPLIIPVVHDLSQPFYHSQAVRVSFSSPLVAISGVALRSFDNFDPVTLSSCQRGETYSPAEQSCVHFACEAMDCPELAVENASLNCSSSDRYHGAQCTVSCQTGYVLQIQRDDELIKSQTGPSITVTCTEGKWNKQVTCEPVDCGVPDHHHVHAASFSCLEGTTFGSKCSFQCRHPAQLKGNNSLLTCMEDGLWSFPEALCELMCLAPLPVPNADLQTARCRENKHKVGSFCKYKCKPGYHVPGSSRKSKKRAFKTQCTQDGSWQEAACVPVTCDPPPPKFHGLYQCTNGFQFNSECRIKCEDSDSSQGRGSNVIHCRKDGTWSGSFHVCQEMQGQCSAPNQLNSNLKLQCPDGYAIGSECATSCLDHNSESIILPVNVTVRDIPHWLNPTRVERVVCTAGLKWYPHPALIHCVKGCEPFMGDNYCDAINNRAFCNYDGGDCCTSTVKTKKVTPFPMSCDLQGDCACRDPQAQEHSRKDLRGYSHG